MMLLLKYNVFSGYNLMHVCGCCSLGLLKACATKGDMWRGRCLGEKQSHPNAALHEERTAHQLNKLLLLLVVQMDVIMLGPPDFMVVQNGKGNLQHSRKQYPGLSWFFGCSDGFGHNGYQILFAMNTNCRIQRLQPWSQNEYQQ